MNLQQTWDLIVKIYNQSGITIYSSIKDEIGKTSQHPDWLEKSIHGKIVHQIEPRDTFHGLLGEMHNIHVSLAYMPLIYGGQQIGVIEIYNNATKLFERLHNSIIQIILTVFACFSVLYAVLFVAARRTDRNVARWQEVLTENEERLSFALEAAEEGVWDWNPQTDEAIFSKRWQEMIGYSEHDFPNTGAAWVEHLHPDDKDRVLSSVQEYIEGQQPSYVIEFRMRCKDGSWKWILAKGKVLSRDSYGNPLRMVGTQADISDQKQTERALKDSEKKFSSIVEQAEDAIISINETQKIILFNSAAERVFGYSCDEILGEHVNRLIPKRYHEIHLEVVEHFKASKDSKMVRRKAGMVGLRKNGEEFSIETSISRQEGDSIIMTVILRDITERKQLEETNNAYIRRLESMQQIADAISSSLTPDEMLNKAIENTREIFKSDRAWLLHPCDPDAAYWGVPVESTLSEYPGAFASNEKFPMSAEVKQIIHDALNSSSPIVYCPMPSFDTHVDKFAVRSQMMMAIKPKFGKPWLFGLHQCSHERIWSDEEKELFHNIGTRISDILSATHLNRDLQKLSQAVQQAGEAVLITDRNAIIEYVNPSFSKITGYSSEDIIGQTPSLLKSSAQDPSFYKELWDTISGGKVWHGTLIDRRKDGSFYPALMSVAPIFDDREEITHFVSLQQDMTQYKKLEDQFLQAQKMEAIGTLVGGIAHDFNNMLAAIQGNVYLSRLKLKDQPEVVEKLDNIELLDMRAADMVKQLLTFARKDRVEMHALALKPFIKEAYKLAKTAIPENIELVCDTCPEGLIINGDATQLQQALMNLLNNARDAVSDVEHPKISCRLRPFESTDEFHKNHPELNDVRFAELIIRDNGSGISSDLISKIFEPFFTTKGIGEGTGLGLAMVYGAIQSHGGMIEAKSVVGEGTSFYIYLPLKEDAEDLEIDESVITQGHGETILLVDDEESMRNTTVEVLESLGYKVLSARDGEEALQIFIAHQNIISLVITDIVMPKVGGVDLAKSIRKFANNTPIIFATGYDKGQAIAAEDQVDLSVIISKPFSFEILSQLIRRMLTSD